MPLSTLTALVFLAHLAPTRGHLSLGPTSPPADAATRANPWPTVGYPNLSFPSTNRNAI